VHRQSVLVDPVGDPLWLQLLAEKRGSIFHSPAWASVLSEAYGLSVQVHLTTDLAGRPLGGLPFCQISDPVSDRIVSLPFSDYCDPLLTSPQDWEVLFAELETRGMPVSFRCLDDRTALADSRLTVVKRARWHGLELTASLETIWANMASSMRRAIRKALREGVEVRLVDDHVFLQEFMRMHLAVRKRKYRLLAQPYTFFQAICRRFRERDGWFPLMASHRGRFIAATVLLRWNDTLYYKFNASDAEALQLRPNNLLLWEGVKLGKSMGCRSFDLGASDDDQPGLIRFKRSLGAGEKEISHLRYVPNGYLAEREAGIRGVLGQVVELLTDPAVPDTVTGRAGDALYRLFA